MKKSLKKTCTIALAVATTATVAGGVGGAVKLINGNYSKTYEAYADNVDGVMSISNYKKTVNLFDTFTMPTAKLDGQDITEYTVKTPSKKTLTQADITDNKFVVDEIGTYTITYTTDNYQGEVTFKSVASKYTISFVENTERIMPKKVGTNHDKQICVPDYKVTDKDGNDITATTNVDITVTAPNITDKFTVNNERGWINFGNTLLTAGTYVVTYRATDANGNFIAQKQTEFKVVEGDAYTTNKLELSYTAEKPESINVGKTVTLPGVTATIDKESTSVYYTVEVYKNGTEKVNADTEVNGTKVLLRNENGAYEFTANEIANQYTVKYTVVDALGNEAKTEFVIDNVIDNLKPTPIVVDAYDTENVAGLENKDYILASNFDPSKKILINAYYGDDLGTFAYADYKFKREIQNASYEVIYSEEVDANKNLIFNLPANSQLQANEKLAVDENGDAITLEDGTYYVYYTVTDKSGNSSTVHYKFVVDTDYSDGKFAGETIKPEVSFNDTFYASVDKGEKIEFNVPTFSDNKDERLYSEVNYVYLDANEEIIGEATILELDNGKYVIDTNAAPLTAAKVKITALARNDSGEETKKSQLITILSELTGTVAPTVENVADYEANVEQGEMIELPMITFSDDVPDTLNADVTIKCDNNGTVVDYVAENSTTIRSGDNVFYKGGRFVAATPGEYTVSIKATDAAGNVVIKFLNYTVTSPVIAGELRFDNIGLTDKTIELGESFKLPEAKIIGDNANQYNYYVRQVSGPTGALINNDKFTPSKIGEYELEYVMYTGNPLEYNGEEETIKFKVTVEDTTKPEIYVNWKSDKIRHVGAEEDVEGAIEVAYEKGVRIMLPGFSADDMSGIDETKSVITIKNSANSTTTTIKYSEMNDELEKGADGKFYYNFAKDAEYTITYTAYDLQGNSTSESFVIKVGDLDAPVLVVSDNVVKSKYSIGDEINIDLTNDTKNYFTITGGDTKAKVENIKVVLTCNDVEVDNLSKISGKYRFTLDKAGSYALKFTVTDKAGNVSEEQVKNFEIAEKAESSVSTTQVVGTVLIVLSVVVLGGVVVYFIISKRKMDKLYK